MCTTVTPFFFSQTLPLIEFGLVWFVSLPYLIIILCNQLFSCYFSEAWTLNYFRIVLVLVASSTPPTHIHSSRHSIIISAHSHNNYTGHSITISAHAHNNYTGHSITILCMCQLIFNICIKQRGEGSIKANSLMMMFEIWFVNQVELTKSDGQRDEFAPVQILKNNSKFLKFLKTF